MKTKITSLILAAICGLLLTGCCTAHHRTQWEYKVENIPSIGGPGGPEGFLHQAAAGYLHHHAEVWTNIKIA